MARKLPARDRFGRFIARRARRNEPEPDPGRRAPRRRRRSFRRNPGRNVFDTIMGGVTHGLAVLAGDGLSGALVSMTRQAPGTPLGLAVKAAAGVGLGLAAEMAGLRRFADSIVAGAFAGALRPFIVKANIPLLSAGLADYPELAAYPVEALAAYPEPAQLGAVSSQDVDIYGTSTQMVPYTM